MSTTLAAQTPVLDECCHGVSLITSAPRCVKSTWLNMGTEKGLFFWFIGSPQVLFSRFTVRNLLLPCGCLWWVCGQGTTSQVDDASPENWRVSKDGVSEMLISTAVFPPACWTAGSLPSLWLFNAGPSQAQTSWQREAFPLSVRKHRSSATSSLREARLKHSQKMQEDQPDSRICQKPPEFLLAKKKN